MLPKDRSLSVVFRRNTTRDSQKDDIDFSGYDVFWPCGRPAQSSFSKLCKLGVRAVFRKSQPDEAEVSMYLIPVSPDDKRIKVKPHMTYRLNLVRDDNLVTFCLQDGTKTELVFDLTKEEDRVLNWLSPPPPGSNQWVDFIAVT